MPFSSLLSPPQKPRTPLAPRKTVSRPIFKKHLIKKEDETFTIQDITDAIKDSSISSSKLMIRLDHDRYSCLNDLYIESIDEEEVPNPEYARYEAELANYETALARYKDDCEKFKELQKMIEDYTRGE